MPRTVRPSKTAREAECGCVLVRRRARLGISGRLVAWDDVRTMCARHSAAARDKDLYQRQDAALQRRLRDGFKTREGG